MAFDGIVINNLIKEYREKLLDARIYKIYQPEPDELNLVLKTPKGNLRLMLSASASLPLTYLTTETKDNPMTAPAFCMLLRKHLGNGRIVEITQPHFERAIVFRIEHLDEMGDLASKQLIIEIMGKHSNIIFTDAQGKILDSIKRIGAQISSVREVLPGREYVLPPAGEKISPLTLTRSYYDTVMRVKADPIKRMLYTTITGWSPLIAEELCYRAGLDGRIPARELPEDDANRLYQVCAKLTDIIREEAYQPALYKDAAGNVVEYAAVPLTMYADYTCVEADSISEILQTYYGSKNQDSRIRQKSADLRKIVATLLERESKKLDLQERQMKDTAKRDRYRIYGELINTYGYHVEEGASSMTALNYYTNETVEIPLDPTISAAENSKKYFARYTKLKRTAEALEEQLKITRNAVEQLQSIKTSLDLSQSEADLADIRNELHAYGFIKKAPRGKEKERNKKSKPLHYRSSDGFDMYVGKNNYQNEELTFKRADATDWWFHAKQAPGSHVIVKGGGLEELPDRTYEEAGRLAAYYSSKREAPKVEIDYTTRQKLKKTPGGAPGFVIYHTNYSLMAEPDITQIEKIED